MFCFQSVRVGVEFYDWARTFFIPNAFHTVDYNGIPVCDYDQLFVENSVGYRLGPPRFRQLRVKPGEHKIFNLYLLQVLFINFEQTNLSTHCTRSWIIF
jgi:hypothetical protein